MRKLSYIFVITASLIGVVYVAFNIGVNVGYESTYSALNTKAKNDLSQLGAYLALYELEHGNYPDSLEALVGDYLEKITKDPWGNDYGYINDGSKALIYTNGGPGKANEQTFHLEKKKI